MESRTHRQTAPQTQDAPAEGPSAGSRVINFRVPDEMYADLVASADADGRSVSGLLRLLVRNHLASDGATA